MKSLICLAILFLSTDASPDRVVGGEDAEGGQFPFMVLIEVSILGTTPQQLCGGSIISRNAVLSAAHCYEDASFITRYIAKAGILQQNSTQGQSIYAKKIISHPQYVHGATEGYDVAVMILETPFTLNKFVKVIPLPKAGTRFEKGKATIIGWGGQHPTDFGDIPNHLQFAKVDLLPLSQCSSIHGPYQHEICAHDPFMEISSCKGDSGGPLITENPLRLIGVVSRTTKIPVACDGKPVIYTSVSHFIDFIKKNLPSV